MIRVTFKPDVNWAKNTLLTIRQSAAYVAGVMLSEFEPLLNDAPQRSGSYVASFRIAVNGQAAGPTIYPTPAPANWHYMGSEGAIQAAMSHVGGVKAEAVAAGASFAPVSIALVNDVDYVDYAQSQKGRAAGAGGPGDPGNPGSAGHTLRYIAKVRAKLGVNVPIGESMWNSYVHFNI